MNTAELLSATCAQISAEMKNASAVIEEAKHSVLAQRRRIALLERALERIHGHLGASIVQRAASDDEIIAGHIQEADAIALRALRDELEVPAPAQVVDMILKAMESA